jgi:signal transduction histidine kinase
LADLSQLRQVLINLLTNAVQAIEGDGNITIRAKRLTNDDSVTIELGDTGGGIEPDALDKVFDPLYTTKAADTGLGLSICKQIIENHHKGPNLNLENWECR